MPLTFRLDPAPAARLARLVARRASTRSEVVREALRLLMDSEENKQDSSFFDEVEPVVGSLDSGGSAASGAPLSERTGERFRQLMESRRARDPG